MRATTSTFSPLLLLLSSRAALAADICAGNKADPGHCTTLTHGSPGGICDGPGALGGGDARGSCASTNSVPRLVVTMRPQDILDVLDEVSQRFGGSGGSFAAEGTMECQGHVVKWWVD
ncbi:hypothetical protein F4810DRAFT_709484 [Camillea tinctor]|nr:hypothetical protein F4810DRAFT_709484 [Camillea tinctor]